MAKSEKQKKEIQGEKYTYEGKEFVKIKPITFQNLIKVRKLCEDVKTTVTDFAIRFGIDKDVSLKDVIVFMGDCGWDAQDEGLDWFKNNGFIKEIIPESYKLMTKFWAGKTEIMLISSEPGIVDVLNLSTGKCHNYGHTEVDMESFITRQELWELFDQPDNKSFTKILSTAH
jgi:hypothetical protein